MMNRFYRLFLLAAAFAGAQAASAQITIDEVNAREEHISFKDELKSIDVQTEYFNLARYKAERAAIRKQRNYLEFGGGLQGTLTSYNDPWIRVSGGDNSIALVATLNLRHIFRKNLFSIETKFNAKLGYNRMKVETTRKDADGNDYTDSEGIWFKNQDECVIWINPSFAMSKNWSYGSTIQFRSQFVNGYVSRTEQRREHLKSKFMTPGYLDISFGVTYRSPNPKFPININLSPLAMSGTFAESDWIRRQQLDGEGNQIKPAYPYGIEDPDKTSKYEGGSSIEINFDRTFGKTGYLRYRTTIFSFYGWITDIGQRNKFHKYSEYVDAWNTWNAGDRNIKSKPRLPIHPTVRWDNTLDIRATKYLATSISFQLYYNRAQNVDVQTRTLLSVGLSYTFKNKPNP